MKIKNNKKGQVKIQQMAFMIIAVTIFFALVGLFVLVFTFAGVKESAALAERENALTLITKLSESPEFSCGRAFGSSEQTNCVDGDKVIALENQINKYIDGIYWGKTVSNIEIRKLYPLGDRMCTPANYPNCDVLRLLPEEGDVPEGVGVGNFVSLCSKASEEGKLYDKCSLAKIFVFYTEIS